MRKEKKRPVMHGLLERRKRGKASSRFRGGGEGKSLGINSFDSRGGHGNTRLERRSKDEAEGLSRRREEGGGE